jgi:hypothetical protein
MHRLVSVALVALYAQGCAASAQSHRSGGSRPGVVLLDIEGAPPGGPVQARVEELARKRFDIIDAAAYWEAAGKLKAKKLTRRNIARVATELGAVAVIHGKASGKKRRQVVTIYVRDAQNGKLLERYRLTVKNGMIAKKGKRQLDRKLLARVKGAPPPAAEEPAEAETTETAAVESKASDKEGAKTAAAGGKQADEEEEEPPLPPVKYDEDGQAVDDELPPM